MGVGAARAAGEDATEVVFARVQRDDLFGCEYTRDDRRRVYWIDLDKRNESEHSEGIGKGLGVRGQGLVLGGQTGQTRQMGLMKV